MTLRQFGGGGGHCACITLGRWGRPYKRIAESFWFFMPINYAIYAIFLVAGGLEIFPWMHEKLPPHKAVWLTEHFFQARQLVMLGLLMVIDFAFIRNSLRADMGVAAETLGTRAPAWWSYFTAGWRGRRSFPSTLQRTPHRPRRSQSAIFDHPEMNR